MLLWETDNLFYSRRVVRFLLSAYVHHISIQISGAPKRGMETAAINASRSWISTPHFKPAWEGLPMKAEIKRENQGIGKLLALSNRGPYTLVPTRNGIEAQPSVGGLVAALEPILERWGGTWVSWLGRSGVPEDGPLAAPPPEKGYAFREVKLSQEEVRHYYNGFANDCLWPLLHGFLEQCSFRPLDWEVYCQVNQRFAAQAADLEASHRVIWVHDYHLCMVPAFLRERGVGTAIAFFWHVPFPPPEIFEALPWSRQLLAGLLGSDHLAFHDPDYADNFLRCAARLPDAQVNTDAGQVTWQGRQVRVEALPLGIDVAAFQDLSRRRPALQRRAEALRQALGGEVILLGVDRLDYTKGIPERLEAFEALLEEWPEARGKVVLLQVAVPGRAGVQAYRQLRRRVEELVGRINGRFGEGAYHPVHYRARALSRAELVSHYLAADVGLVTPLRDGLNLVSKEYVACKTEGRGALVLSQFAGAARQMEGAILVNPYSREELAAGIRRAVEMDPSEQARRLRTMQAQVASQDLAWWWQQVQAALVGLSSSDSASRH